MKYNLTINPPKCCWPKKEGSQPKWPNPNIIGICSHCVLDRPLFEWNQVLQCGKLNFWSTRPKTDAPYMFYTKFHLPRPVFHSPSSKCTRIKLVSGRALVSLTVLLHPELTVYWSFLFAGAAYHKKPHSPTHPCLLWGWGENWPHYNCITLYLV